VYNFFQSQHAIIQKGITMSDPSPSCWESCKSTFLNHCETIGLKESTQPLTEEFLQKQLRWIMITGVVSTALLALGLLGQIGLLPMGSTIVTIFLSIGASGLILSGVTGYLHWKRRAAYEHDKAKPDQSSFMRSAKNVWNNYAPAPSTWFSAPSWWRKS
jgi:hypothetical protein